MVKEEHNVKSIEFINAQSVVINGDEFVKRKHFVKPLEHIVNQVHFRITGHVINICGKICMYCGKVFKRDELNKITKHHCIPVALSPKYDVLIPVCKECHMKINRKIKIRK